MLLLIRDIDPHRQSSQIGLVVRLTVATGIGQAQDRGIALTRLSEANPQIYGQVIDERQFGVDSRKDRLAVKRPLNIGRLGVVARLILDTHHILSEPLEHQALGLQTPLR